MSRQETLPGVGFHAMLTALLLIALAQRQRAVKMPVQEMLDWKIEITTDGGITGAGTDDVTVSSDGVLVITLLTKKECTYRLTTGELQMINAAIANVRPTGWLACYLPADVTMQCCDLIRETLKLLLANRRTYVTSWLSDAAPFPSDLANLVDVLRGPAGVDARYRQLCVMTP